MLNVLSGYIQEDERILTIEDAAELQLQQSHVVRLETRPANIEGRGSISQRELVKNALRMRPDRIILGEVRGDEAFDMLQAMNTGHDGSLATIHANSPRDCLARLESMIAMTGMDMPLRMVRQQIASAVDLVVQVARLEDGQRKVISVSEIIGMEGDIITMSEVFGFKRRGISSEGKVIGQVAASGVVPSFYEKILLRGISIPPDVFVPDSNLDEAAG
jgi:pilus assembly protein CpaF